MSTLNPFATVCHVSGAAATGPIGTNPQTAGRLAPRSATHTIILISCRIQILSTLEHHAVITRAAPDINRIVRARRKPRRAQIAPRRRQVRLHQHLIRAARLCVPIQKHSLRRFYEGRLQPGGWIIGIPAALEYLKQGRPARNRGLVRRRPQAAVVAKIIFPSIQTGCRPSSNRSTSRRWPAATSASGGRRRDIIHRERMGAVLCQAIRRRHRPKIARRHAGGRRGAIRINFKI